MNDAFFTDVDKFPLYFNPLPPPQLRQTGSKICNKYTPTHKTDFLSVYHIRIIFYLIFNSKNK